MNKEQEQISKKQTSKKPAKETLLSARDRIKPRGLWGLFKGRIYYDKNADIFNLGI